MNKVCLECGEEKPLCEFIFMSKTRRYKSVCKQCIKIKVNKTLSETIGFALHDKQRAADRMHINAARARAKKKGIEFNLDESDFQIPTHCPILGTELRQTWGNVNEQSTESHCPSIDRIDNSKGYIKGNVAIISNAANRMKSSLTYQEIESFCKNIMRYMTP